MKQTNVCDGAVLARFLRVVPDICAEVGGRGQCSVWEAGRSGIVSVGLSSAGCWKV